MDPYYVLSQTQLELPSDFIYKTSSKKSKSGGAGEGAVDAAPVLVKDIFDLKLKAVDPKNKIKIIKEIRGITGLGLKEVSSPLIFQFFLLSFSQAKELVEKAPVVIKTGLKKDEIDSLTKLIVAAGGEVEVE